MTNLISDVKCEPSPELELSLTVADTQFSGMLVYNISVLK